MKVECSFSLLLRLAFWLGVVAIFIGAVLGSATGSAPANPVKTAVATHGEEVR
ncbi:hypothetical protein [Amycolatopsis sp. lyj-112]|uniref:hypothetical protein n=1 Tax=Amycolatopsis sp. lyj-112 TaxID=2789288 RepID=UPI00397DBB4F